jgi:urease accessory protein
MLGTGLHLGQVPLPQVELLVSLSILLFGGLIVFSDRLNGLTIAGLAGLAGIFHGYAYGEAIFGAEMTPLVAYLAGFGVVQATFAVGTAWIAQKVQPNLNLRSAGLVVAGVGLAFVMSQFSAMLFPAP